MKKGILFLVLVFLVSIQGFSQVKSSCVFYSDEIIDMFNSWFTRINYQRTTIPELKQTIDAMQFLNPNLSEAQMAQALGKGIGFYQFDAVFHCLTNRGLEQFANFVTANGSNNILLSYDGVLTLKPGQSYRIWCAVQKTIDFTEFVLLAVQAL